MKNLSVLLALCGIFGLVSENAVAASFWQMNGDSSRADRFEAIATKFQDRMSARQDRISEKVIQRMEWNYESLPEEAQKIFSWDDVDAFYTARKNPLLRFISEDGQFGRFHFGNHNPDFQSLAINNPKFAEYFQSMHPELTGIASSVVPIPASVWLFGSALGALGWARRRKSVV
jgi:hypothetical protein